MFYHSGGVASADLIYLILLIPVMILSVWAQAQVSGNFRKYSQVRCARGMTGREAAEAVLRAHHVSGVRPSKKFPGTSRMKVHEFCLARNIEISSTCARTGQFLDKAPCCR